MLIGSNRDAWRRLALRVEHALVGAYAEDAVQHADDVAEARERNLEERRGLGRDAPPRTSGTSADNLLDKALRAAASTDSNS